MKVEEFNPERELFISLYATKLKEMRQTPYAQCDIRELERIAERRLDAVERAMEGDRTTLERHLQQTALTRGKESYKAHHVVMALDAFRDVAKAVRWRRCEDFVKADDVLHWAVATYVRIFEEVMTERGLVRMVESLTLALEAKEKYTSSHSQSVQKIGEKIARALGVNIGLAGLFHDIGKIHIPDSILTKSSELNEQEMAVMRQHPYHSFRIISPIYPEAASLVLRHHERPDGGGYPLGEKEIPVEANVVAAADTLHSICSDRVYRRHRKLDIALDQIRKGKSAQFLPDVVWAVERSYGDMANLLADISAKADVNMAADLASVKNSAPV
jgi:HD-GYP domain-containing protein (c-di-GMP phosphodiesterase class II)